MITRATATAYANIALVKYWGKRKGKPNAPATPSISLTLDKLKTVTNFEIVDKQDTEFIINDEPADKTTRERLIWYLDYWRKEGYFKDYFRIESKNHFPTKSGLASSSSGYAALAIGLSSFSRKKISVQKLSELARIGSGSAARSITGGISSLPVDPSPSAKLLLPPEEIPWGMVICEVDMGEKEIDSRKGMEISRMTSPYYNTWVLKSQRDYLAMLAALKNLDLELIGHIMESNTLAMHSCMITSRPSLIYWTGTTVEILHAVKKWRKSGLEVYATMDAGPHVILLGNLSDLEKIASRARRVNGVAKTTKCYPADGASVVSWN